MTQILDREGRMKTIVEYVRLHPGQLSEQIRDALFPQFLPTGVSTKQAHWGGRKGNVTMIIRALAQNGILVNPCGAYFLPGTEPTGVEEALTVITERVFDRIRESPIKVTELGLTQWAEKNLSAVLIQGIPPLGHVREAIRILIMQGRVYTSSKLGLTIRNNHPLRGTRSRFPASSPGNGVFSIHLRNTGQVSFSFNIIDGVLYICGPISEVTIMSIEEIPVTTQFG